MALPFYTVHPFGDEWTWDPATGGREADTRRSIEEVTELAIAVKESYADVDPEWRLRFWSEIWVWPEFPHTSNVSGRVVGFVTHDGEFIYGKPSVDSMGYLQEVQIVLSPILLGALNRWVTERGLRLFTIPVEDDLKTYGIGPR